MPTKEAEQHRPSEASFEYRLQHTPAGVVLLDPDLSIRSVNPVAQRLLASGRAPVLGANIVDLHPQQARDKIAWLIERARTSPDGNASLLVATAGASMVAKVSRLDGGDGALTGYCMIVHALSNAPVMGQITGTNAGSDGKLPADALCPLMKLPLVRGKTDVISLIDVADVVCLVAQGHYAEAKTLSYSAFCPRPLADLERRLDPAAFLRVHRRYVVNMRHVRGAERLDGSWHLILADQAATRIPVSRTKVETVRRLLAV
ncbi:LytTR family transcriptional regulator DNA-binding domain-containing protein [Hyphomicrobium sp. NDB2Meth4]|uniref:LytTR family DNA-binding domain-containing protein n=1 Tax=Hyphomicrobium sp. NDB2Meth4 TaxID=1892846 RepID=UPI000931C9FA|nr:LytTR family transcriptional regulator DNA-binding domain-containing protein [Hyphomicrobium sp. NDB2Meth4]